MYVVVRSDHIAYGIAVALSLCEFRGNRLSFFTDLNFINIRTFVGVVQCICNSKRHCQRFIVVYAVFFLVLRLREFYLIERRLDIVNIYGVCGIILEIGRVIV